MTPPMKCAVIGRGLIGSAAARHLAKAGCEVTLIGPAEPEQRRSHTGVFGSHYDEGRITRLLDPHLVWEDLAAASIHRYPDIAAESGISFFDEEGLLIGAPNGSDFLERLRSVRTTNNISSTEFEGAALRKSFPYLRFGTDMVMLHQPKLAGYISPRRLVAAQSKAAERHGAKIINDYVRKISGNAVTTAEGTVKFDRILVAAGAFTNTLLNPPLDLRVLGRTIAFFELDAEEAKRLEAMPSVIFRVPDNSDPYVLPPIRYPNGKTYLKIGGEPDALRLETADALTQWFKTNGDETLIPYLTERMETLIPGLRYQSVRTESCAVTYTETGVPYVGAVSDHLCVATGGCGGAAKSSDELGRIAAETMLGNPDPRFEIKYQKELTT